MDPSQDLKPQVTSEILPLGIDKSIDKDRFLEDNTGRCGLSRLDRPLVMFGGSWPDGYLGAEAPESPRPNW